MMQCELHVFKGWFYLPESPSEKVPGILTWDPSGGATLELIGGFSPPPRVEDAVCDQMIGDVRDGTIFGLIESKKLSIWNARRGNYSADSNGTVKSEWWSSTQVCFGAHIADPNEQNFSKITLMLDDLYYLAGRQSFLPPEWANIEGIEHPGETLEDGTCLVPYKLPVVGGCHANLHKAQTRFARYSIATQTTRPPISEVTKACPNRQINFMTQNKCGGPVIELRTSTYFAIQFPDDKKGTVAELIDCASPVIDLVHLATFRSPRVATVSLEPGDKKDRVYLLSRIGDIANPNENHDHQRVVFSLSDLSLQDFLNKWQDLTHSKQSSYAWSVVVGLCGYSSTHVEEYVSQALAAAEGFHTWCLGKGNGVSLKDRLTQLYELLPLEVRKKLNFEVDKWATEAKNARNHVSHGGKRGEIFADVLRFYALAESVHLVTYLVLLDKLQIPVDKICDAMSNHPRISLTVNRSSGFFSVKGDSET